MSAVMDEDASPGGIFELNPRLDQDKLCAEFRENYRMRIPDFLQPTGALALYKHLAREIEWRAFLVASGKLLAAPPGLHGEYPADLTKLMFDRAYEGTRHGFTFLFEVDRLFPEDLPRGVLLDTSSHSELLAQFTDFLNSTKFLSFARTTTGSQAIERVAVQATRHRRGHFATFQTQTAQTDRCESARVGFSLTLTPEWAPEWGGLLEFRTQEGGVMEGYVPSFNVLDLFALPQGHWVSPVAPFAEGDRLAISGRLYAP